VARCGRRRDGNWKSSERETILRLCRLCCSDCGADFSLRRPSARPSRQADCNPPQAEAYPPKCREPEARKRFEHVEISRRAVGLVWVGRMDGTGKLLSQKCGDKRWTTVNALNEALDAMQSGAAGVDLEAVFEGQYKRISRAIAVIIHDPSRAEELAVEVFLKWSRNGATYGPNARGWLYKTAVRMALDELRRAARRDRFEGLLTSTQNPPTPHAVLSAKQDEERVRAVLAAMPCRQAEMLLLRSQGFDYAGLAAALDLNPASIGKLLSRAQQAFRKEYVKRYGEQ